MNAEHSSLCFELEDGCRAAETGRRCSACTAYAEMMGLAAAPEDVGPAAGEILRSPEAAPETPLPAGLGARLRAIADDFSEADPLYVSALAGEPLGEREHGGEEPARRAAHDALAETFAAAKAEKPLPPVLEGRLRSIPRRRSAERLPVWLTDSRWAAAACLLLTSTLGLAAGDVSARFQETAAVVSHAPAWIEQSGWKPQSAAGLHLEPGFGETFSTLREQAEKRLGETLESVQSRQRELSEDFKTSASQRYAEATAHARAAASDLKKTKTARWLAEFAQEGDSDE